MRSSHDENCHYSIRLIDKLASLDTQNKLDFYVINKAIDWAKKYHDGQFRKSDEPFYTHPLEVAYVVADYQLKTDILVSSILHDIVEDTEITIGMILDNFGWRIAEMIDRLTRDRPSGIKLSIQEILNNAYRKNDTEVLLIKAVDRLHNMQTIMVQEPEKIEETCKETISEVLLICYYIENKYLADALYDLGLGALNKFEQPSFSYLKDNDKNYLRFLVA